MQHSSTLAEEFGTVEEGKDILTHLRFRWTLIVHLTILTVSITMKFNYYTFWLPLCAYLQQPLFNPESPMVWSPQHFWTRYQLTLLERCWERSHQEGHPQA